MCPLSSRSFLIVLCALTVLFSANNAPARPQSLIENQIKVIAYSTQAYPLRHEQSADEVYYIDQVEKIEEKMSAQLSAHPATAEQQIRQLMQTPQWKSSERELINAYKGVTSAWEYGVMKVPAVIFVSPNQSVDIVYGETSIDDAITVYIKHSEQQPGQSYQRETGVGNTQVKPLIYR